MIEITRNSGLFSQIFEVISKLNSENIGFFNQYGNFYNYFQDTTTNVEYTIVVNGTQTYSIVVDLELRKRINKTIQYYFMLNNNIQKQVDKYVRMFEGKKVLGVHIRQTDHHVHGRIVSIEEYIREIDKEIDNYDLLFVMSDNSEAVQILNEKYSYKMCTLPYVIRTDTMTEDRYYEQNYKTGSDVLIETHILSHCDKMLLVNSNICSYVICLNLDNEWRIIDLDLEKNN